MKNWDDLKYCLALSRHGTMSNAAKVLGTNVATVSRRLHRMSEEIGEPLFIKEGNRWAVTEAGAELARIAEELQSRIGSARPEAPELGGEVKIRISCAMQIMQCGMVDGIVGFLEEYPRARLTLESRKLSLALNECDIRIGFEEPREGRIVRRLMTELAVVPACRRRFRSRVQGWLNVLYTEADCPGAPRLREHFGAAPKIEIEGLNLTRMVLSSNPLVAVLPRTLVASDPDLVEFPLGGASEALPVWLSYHQSRRRDPAVRLAVQFLEQAMRLEPGLADALSAP